MTRFMFSFIVAVIYIGYPALFGGDWALGGRERFHISPRSVLIPDSACVMCTLLLHNDIEEEFLSAEGEVEIAAGSTSGCISPDLAAVADNILENNETFIITLNADSTNMSMPSAIITIEDTNSE